MQLKDFVTEAGERLEPVYGREEAGSMIRILYSSVLGVPGYFHVTEPQHIVSGPELAKLMNALDRLCSHEPLQYILGKTEFCGLTFHVSPAVLIHPGRTPSGFLICARGRDALPGLSPTICRMPASSGRTFRQKHWKWLPGRISQAMLRNSSGWTYLPIPKKYHRHWRQQEWTGQTLSSAIRHM